MDDPAKAPQFFGNGIAGATLQMIGFIAVKALVLVSDTWPM